jgi:hypothetical protein
MNFSGGAPREKAIACIYLEYFSAEEYFVFRIFSLRL